MHLAQKKVFYQKLSALTQSVKYFSYDINHLKLVHWEHLEYFRGTEICNEVE